MRSEKEAASRQQTAASTCSDLISRQAAIDYFVTNIVVVDEDGFPVDDYDERMKVWTERFSGIPSAEPEERTAKVENIEKPNVYKCSECGQYFHSTAWGSPVAYCSRCGAKLDWGGEKNE